MPTPALAVPYAAPKQVKTMALVQPIAPKNGYSGLLACRIWLMWFMLLCRNSLDDYTLPVEPYGCAQRDLADVVAAREKVGSSSQERMWETHGIHRATRISSQLFGPFPTRTKLLRAPSRSTMTQGGSLAQSSLVC
nr:hypothetical protein CFP56_53713 [Quercus suber]